MVFKAFGGHEMTTRMYKIIDLVTPKVSAICLIGLFWVVLA